jgi:hypothetical protein
MDQYDEISEYPANFDENLPHRISAGCALPFMASLPNL